MIATPQQILESFETLPDSQKHWVAMEIMRRTPDISEDDMINSLHAAADEAFVRLDAEEANRNGGAQSSTR